MISGPIYSGHGKEMSESAVKPSAYFKVISTPESLSAFIFDSNVRQHVSFCDQVSTLELIEAATGLTLFPQRENAIAATLHAQLTCAY